MYRSNKSLTGTVRYASINTHMGIEQSRRDDIESMMYVLIYFLKGKLPWQGVLGKNKHEKYKKIMQIKIATPVERLCENCPCKFHLQILDEFQDILKYARSLKFDEDPDHSLIKKQLKNALDAKDFDYDLKFDWITQSSISKDFSAFLINQERQQDIKLGELNKDNEERKLPPADPQLMDKIVRMLEKDRNASIEVNCTGKSQTSFSKENQDRTGSTTVDKPPAPALPMKTAPTENEARNEATQRATKKCGCGIF
eukprot:TRINITY_DN1984_c0_g1_i12.p1 TRINITY_DN1984_c0_g1~~TRINITY_DN1984_c0_g1_i12.p1  ORF type:complete len:255 (+),score=55.45 TRINITY_DN1984_c0_g1_i12:752-1516(+)